ncbi:MAG TPA: M20 family metallopeptidase [Pirellulales bacterium]|jgi:acetylornithine deacetylase|nr:M20 family metallopeptidase [Pirellulales bacterium]
MTSELVQMLSELVALPSVNPMGRAPSGPEYLEDRVTDYLEAFFGQLNLPCQRQTVEPRRDNIVARLDGAVPCEQGGRLILFEAHQDTVPVGGMTIDPWTPLVRDGRLYGRGSCDVKGGLAAMLGAFARLAHERPAGMPTLIMAATVNEEDGHSGATALTQLWSQADSLIPRRPDAAIIAEPTLLQVVVAHKGVVRWRCHAHGKATHSSQPHLGVNAIFKMSAVLSALERYHREVLRDSGGHRLCGSPTLSVGTIAGGLSVNTVPDLCTIEIDRRLIPGEDPHAAYRDVIAFVAVATGDDPAIVHEPPFIASAGLDDDANGPLAAHMAAAARAVGLDSRAVGVPYGTNAAAIAAAGVPSIVFGPGSIDQAHTADEWISLEQLSAASDALYQFGRAGDA